jgi:hypothetical protein
LVGLEAGFFLIKTPSDFAIGVSQFPNRDFFLAATSSTLQGMAGTFENALGVAREQEIPVEMLNRQVKTRCGVIEILTGAVETPDRAIETLSRQVETQNRALETLRGGVETHFRGIETQLFCPGERSKLFFRYSDHFFERSRHTFDQSNDFSLCLKASDDQFKEKFLLSKNFFGRFNRSRIQFYPSE